LSNTAVGTGYDQSWITVHGISEGDIKIHSHACKNRPDSGSKVQILLIFLIKYIVNTGIDLKLFADIICSGQIKDIERIQQSCITYIAISLPDESTLQVCSQTFDRLIA